MNQKFLYVLIYIRMIYLISNVFVILHQENGFRWAFGFTKMKLGLKYITEGIWSTAERP